MILPETENILLFLVAATLLIIIPGPAVLYVMSKSIEQGYKAGFVSVLGIGVGGLVHVFAAGVGISAVLVASATAFSILKYLGALYLIYLGVKKLFDKRTFDQQVVHQKQKLSRVFSEGVLVNMFNPKTAIFFFAFLPQFVNVQIGGITSQVLFLGLLFIVLAICSDSLYVLISGRLAIWVKKNPLYARVHKYVSGGIYIFLGLITLTTSRPVQAAAVSK